MWRGISYPFRRGVSNLPEVSEDANKVRESISQILRTRRGERLMQPEFGSDLWSLVFENMGEATIALGVYEINRSLSLWEPRIRLTNVTGREVGENQIEFYIEYILQGSVVSQTELFDRSVMP